MEFIFDLFLCFTLRLYSQAIYDGQRQKGEGSGEDNDMCGIVIKINFGEDGEQHQCERSADPANYHRKTDDGWLGDISNIDPDSRP